MFFSPSIHPSTNPTIQPCYTIIIQVNVIIYDTVFGIINSTGKAIIYFIFAGFLESLDDFYLLGSKMVMLQTTNSILRRSLYKHVKPNSVLAWQRVRTANMMSRSGKEWASTVAKFNSGRHKIYLVW